MRASQELASGGWGPLRQLGALPRQRVRPRCAELPGGSHPPLANSLEARQRGAVKVDVSPLAVAALPDACLLEAGGEGASLGVEALVQPDVADHGDVPHETDVRRRHGRTVIAPGAA